MPHLITHRPRVSNLNSVDKERESHKLWETVNTFSYEAGGLTFVLGSVFFFPALSAYLAVGDWLFFFGSLLYLMVTGHDLIEVVKYWRIHHTDTFADYIEFVASVSYVFGCVLFTVGSLGFLPSIGATAIGSWCFIIGSVAFVIGGMVNIVQVVEAPSLIYMQLFNITVALFLMGSVLFVVASVPYLWHLNPQAETRLTTFAAAQFLAGSLMFLLGGISVYYRNLVRDRLEEFCRAGGLGVMFIRELQSEIRDKAQLMPGNSRG